MSLWCRNPVIFMAVFAAATPLFAQTAPATAPASAPVAPVTTLPAPGTLPAPASAPVVPIVIPTTATAPAATSPATPAAPATQEAPFTQPFVGAITGDRVYIRSGPDRNNYEVGQLVKGDLVYVVGATKGWYKILPPNGSFCMIAKEFVEVDAGGTSGTVKGDFINVRAGSASLKGRDPWAVLTTVRKGTKLKILGSSDTYYQIAPPDGAAFYISPQFVKAAPGTDYKVPELKLAAGLTGPTGVTVEAPTTLPTATAIIPPGPETVTGTGAPATEPVVATAPATRAAPATAPAVDLPPIVPAVRYSATATARFNDVNGRYQDEARKPIAQQALDGYLKDFQEILAMENLAPSVKAGAEADVAAIQRVQSVQKLIADQANAQQSTRAKTEALQAQFDEAQKALEAARNAGPYSAEGVLQTSTIVVGKYALVNPQTGRVVAYVDPATASIDISKLIGQYIGVRGITKKQPDSDIKVIEVSNATMLPLRENK